MLVLRVLSLALLSVPSLALAARRRRSDAGNGELQLDASLRLRGLYYDPTRFGIGGSEDGYGLLRALASATYVEDTWQAKLQLGVHAENGKAGGRAHRPWCLGRAAGVLALAARWLCAARPAGSRLWQLAAVVGTRWAEHPPGLRWCAPGLGGAARHA